MKLYHKSPWSYYSHKLTRRIQQPQFSGYFTQDEACERRVRLVMAREGTKKEGSEVAFYWFVDGEDGIIVDVRFQVYGPSALIAAADAAAELLMRKNYDQAKRITADLIDRVVRTDPDKEAFPIEALPYLNLVLEAIFKAAAQCGDIPFAETYAAPPMELHSGEVFSYPGWQELSVQQQIAVIEEVINREIRPYIELDAGGVQIIDLIDGRELIIAYQGACTSCFSATGATLSAIQQILRTKVFPDLEVKPDLSFLKLEGSSPH